MKPVFLLGGFVSLGLGALGSVIPLLPTFPFLLLSGCCFARSSKRLSKWFISTRLYKDNLESFSDGKGMTKKAKSRIISVVSLTMSIGFLMMKNAPVGRIILLIVWISHIFYFVCGIKTLNEVSE